MARIVIAELDLVDGYKPRPPHEALVDRSAEEGIVRAVRAVEAGRAAFSANPFIMYLHGAVNGVATSILLCRHSAPEHAPASEGCEYVSYLAPKGQLAARTLGAEAVLPTPGGPLT